jgi:hypothetical protein
MSFEEFLLSKKINLESFNLKQPTVFLQWKTEFEAMHPESFVMQKKFSIDHIRRLYPVTN